ncbi:MAG: nitroreductase family protein [Planctomycetota bacterium]|nr:nitroreductase family protein [Planctomycetota bacterium]
MARKPGWMRRPEASRRGAQSRAIELLKGLPFRRALGGGIVSGAGLRAILDAARASPSLAGTQPWKFMVFGGESVRGLLVERAGSPGEGFTDLFAGSGAGSSIGRDFENAGAFIVVLGDRHVPFWRESCILCAHQMLLAARAIGLEARVYAPLSPGDLAGALMVPEGYVAALLVAVGTAGVEDPGGEVAPKHLPDLLAGDDRVLSQGIKPGRVE